MGEGSYFKKLFSGWKAPENKPDKNEGAVSERELETMIDYLKKNPQEQSAERLNGILLKLLVKAKDGSELAKKFDLPKLRKEAAEKYARCGFNEVLDLSKPVGNNVSGFLRVLQDLIMEAGVKLSDVLTPEEVSALKRREAASHLKNNLLMMKARFTSENNQSNNVEVGLSNAVMLQREYKFSAKELGITQEQLDKLDEHTFGEVAN